MDLGSHETAQPLSSSTAGTHAEHLDLATVINVLQAVSGETVLEKLLDTLMRTAMEHAGAERGLLILSRGAERRIAAEVTMRGAAVNVRVQDERVSSAALPESVLNYVARTQESVILDDASAQNAFSADPYLRRQQTRSLLCLPLSTRGKLIGVIYLENRAPRVFAPARITVLKVLASQAAMSLENARLYRDVAEREAKFRRLVDANIVGILIWDLEGAILDANDEFLRMVGYEREDLLSGRLRWNDLTPAEWHERDLERVAELKRTGRLQPFEKEYFHKDGSRVPVLLGLASFAGESQGVGFVLDLTERKRVERSQRQSEAYLAEAQRLTHTGSWAFNHVIGQHTYYSSEQFRIHGLNPQADHPPQLEEIRNLFHPEDRERMLDLIERVVREKREYTADYRIALPDGTVKHLHSTGHPIIDAAGELVEHFGTVVDVTEHRRAEQRLLAQHSVARILAEAATAEEATPKILHAVCECMGWHVGVVWRVDRKAGELRCAEMWRTPSVEASQLEALTRARTFRLGSGVPGRVWASRTPAYISDVVHDPEFGAQAAMSAAGLRSAFALPILLGSEVLGVVGFFSRDVWHSDPNLLDMMATIGSQIGQFTKHAAAEQALRQSEAYLAEAQRLTHTGSWAYTRVSDGRALYWSNETFRLFGLDPERRAAPTLEEVGKLIHPDEREQMIKDLIQIFRAKAEYEQKYRIVMPDGTVRHLHSIGHPVLDSAGELAEYVGTIMDVSERTCAEQRLLAQQRVARILAEATTLEEATPKILQAVCECMGWDIGVRWRIDREAGVLRFGQAWRKVPAAPFEIAARANTFGFGSGLPGRVWESRTPAQVADIVRDPESYTNNAARAGLHAAFALPILLNSEVIGVMGFFSRDVWQVDADLLDMMATLGSQIGQFTKRAAAEQGLRQSEAYLAEAQRLSHTGTWVYARAGGGRAVYWSNETFRLFGLDPARRAPPHLEEVGRLIYLDDREQTSKELTRIFRAKVEYEQKFRIVMPDGTVRHLHSIGHPVLNSAGELVEYVGTIMDVTERTRAEQRLLAQHRIARILGEVATMAEATPKILQAVCECMGWHVGIAWRIDREAGVLRGQEVWHDPSVEIAELEAATWARTFQPGSGVAGRVWASRKPAYVSDVACDPEFGARAEMAAAGLRAAFAVPILLGTDVLGVLGFCSRDVWQPDQDLLDMMTTVGSQIGQFTKRAAAVDEAQLRVSMLHHLPVAAWSVTPDGTPDIVNEQYFEYTGRTPEQVHLRTDAWMDPIHPDDRERATQIYWDGIRSGQGFAMEARLRARDGTYRWHLNHAVPVRDSAGNVLRFVGTFTDVHDWRQAQEALRNTQAELAHTTRVLTMGELTASIAHEVNQPLGAIVASAAAGERWLAATPPQLDKARRALERIVNDGKRAGEVIKRVRALMKRQAPQKDWLEINEAILEVIAIVQHQLHRNDIALETQLAEGLPLVRGDRVQLQQVLLNLIVNAIEAMNGVDGRCRELTIVSAADGPEAVAIEVRDRGMGLDAERAAHLFEPFYTTKSEGIGIGLSISRTIVEAHGGHLSATANSPHGAVFRFSLPVDEPVS